MIGEKVEHISKMADRLREDHHPLYRESKNLSDLL